MWQDAFTAQIAEVETRSGTNPIDWRKGGIATKANPDKEDKVWWDENGKKMFFDFINSWQESNMEIWQSPTGVPGIEIEFNNYFGDVLIKAFADLIAVTPAGELAVVDFKTGKSVPNSSMQLGVYACCMEMTFGIRPTKGYYYSARKAEFVEVGGMERWSIPVMTEMFSQFAKGLEAEIFLPNVGMNCSTCGVKEYCYAVGGQLATIYDPLALIK
jgi:RecB family exonuclease